MMEKVCSPVLSEAIEKILTAEVSVEPLQASSLPYLLSLLTSRSVSERKSQHVTITLLTNDVITVTGQELIKPAEHTESDKMISIKSATTF